MNRWWDDEEEGENTEEYAEYMLRIWGISEDSIIRKFNSLLSRQKTLENYMAQLPENHAKKLQQEVVQKIKASAHEKLSLIRLQKHCGLISSYIDIKKGRTSADAYQVVERMIEDMDRQIATYNQKNQTNNKEYKELVEERKLWANISGRSLEYAIKIHEWYEKKCLESKSNISNLQAQISNIQAEIEKESNREESEFAEIKATIQGLEGELNGEKIKFVREYNQFAEAKPNNHVVSTMKRAIETAYSIEPSDKKHVLYDTTLTTVLRSICGGRMENPFAKQQGDEGGER